MQRGANPPPEKSIPPLWAMSSPEIKTVYPPLKKAMILTMILNTQAIKYLIFKNLVTNTDKLFQ